MKALILAAGRGKRLEGDTEDCNKCMLRFHGKHLIEYSLEAASLTDVDEIITVVGYRAEDIVNTFGISYKNKRIRYVIQQEQKGLVHAIETAASALDGHGFILFLADEIFLRPNPQKLVEIFEKENLFCVCGVTRVDDKTEIKKTYAVIYDEHDNRIYRLIEKPRNPMNNLMGTGNCVFKNEILKYIPVTPINQVRNEKELPDLIQAAIDDGLIVKLVHVEGKYVNINTPEDIKLAEDLIAE